MSNILGIVCEYNPFHNGHLYHLTESKKITNSDYSVAVISGNFTQRGEPSIINKWLKAEMALKSGVDLVIELPSYIFNIKCRKFCSWCSKILDSLNIVDFFIFWK